MALAISCLALPPQQHIEILTKDPGEGWHTGIVSGQPRKGIFPSNYVKITRQGQAHTAGAASLPRYKGFLSKKSPKKGAGCVPIKVSWHPRDLIAMPCVSLLAGGSGVGSSWRKGS